MGFLLSVLGSLPSSDSARGTLGTTDYKKMFRMGFVLVVSYCGVAIVEALIRSLTNGEIGIPPTLVTPVTGLLSLVLEGLRRMAANPETSAPPIAG